MAPGFRIRIDGEAAAFACAPGEAVLMAMERAGLARIPVGCRGGGCGICKVAVVQGAYHCKRMSRDHVSMEDEAAGRVLACRLLPDSDMTVRSVGGLFKRLRRSGDWR